MNRRKHLLRVALLSVACAAMAEPAEPAKSGYVDTAVCAGCHRQISDNYSRTGMARSFRSVQQDSHLPEFDGGKYDHEASREHFETVRRDNKYYVRRYQTQGGGQQVNVLDVPVDYVIGSGDHAASYLHRTKDNKLIEFPVTWYAESGGHWGMSPAYDRPAHSGFSREISYRCMFCHNSYPEVSTSADSEDGATIFPAKLPEGIDCQRCHGPAARHVAAAGQGRSPGEIRATIVNPARLDADRQMEVCMQCHLETTSMQLPGAIKRFTRGVFSYRPGEPLSDYLVYFDHAPGTDHDEKFELVSSAYRLRKSACFAASEGALRCTSCHDPHQVPSRPEALRKTDAVCLGCHAAKMAALVREGSHTAAMECASCHMPRRQGIDAIHITVTDHLIQRPRRNPAAAIEEHDGNTLPYAGRVVPYYPKDADPLYSAVAQIRELANLPAGLADLEKILAGLRPRMGAPYFDLAEAYFETGQPARSIVHYQEALKLEPGNWRYMYGFGQAALAVGRRDVAIRSLEEAVAAAPEETNLLEGLGAAYASVGRIPDAVKTFRRASIRNPENAAAWNNLGKALAAGGNLREAEAAFREAVRLQPEMAPLRVNLAGALMRTGNHREAAFQLEEAIRSGPSTGLARAAWSAGLAVSGNVAEGRRRYDESLRTQLSGAHNNLGTAFVSMGNAEAAIREYRLALTSDPRSALAALNLGLTLAAHSQPGEARRWLEEALRLEPGLAEAHLKLGELLMAEGLPNEGKAHLRLAAESSDARVRTVAARLLSGVH